MSIRRIVSAAAMGVTALTLCECSIVNCFVRSEDVLNKMNTPSKLDPPPDTTEEIGYVFDRGMTDSYWHYWTTDDSVPFTADAATAPLSKAVWCVGSLVAHPQGPSANATGFNACFSTLFDALNFPKEPDPQLELKIQPPGRNGVSVSAAVQAEQDVVRLEARLKSTVYSAVAYLMANHAEYFAAPAPKAAPPEWARVDKGIADGLALFTTYQLRHGRTVNRAHSPRALVLSGGSANGAFSAGAVWWLLMQLDKCTACRAPGQDVRIDMVAGASTGSLIAVLVKDFFVGDEPHRAGALGKLTDNYLCSVDSSLYCITDAGVIDLGLTGESRETGLVRFSGIARLLQTFIDRSTFQSPVELFASTTDYRTGHLFHLSSADPDDIPDVDTLRQAVLASIVEPGMSEPIYRIGKRRGFFIDGGIRSGLPVLGPLRGGAEHVVTLTNEQMDMLPLHDYPGSALSALLRSIDLMTFQPIVGELNQGEYELATRRTEEYEICMDRVKARREDYALKQGFCTLRPTRMPGATSATVVPSGSPQLALLQSLYRSAWIFQPRAVPKNFQSAVGDLTTLNSAGYSFNPTTMWRQFMLGAAVMQERCEEVASVLGWSNVTPFRCLDEGTLDRELAALQNHLLAKGCYKKPMGAKVCGTDEPPISAP